MADKFFQIKSFFRYWLDAVDEHSLHSPFFFDFYTKVLRQKPDYQQYKPFEDLRGKLLRDERAIECTDLGVKRHEPAKRKISSIAASSLTPQKYSALYVRMIRHFNHRTVVELGTSFGINTLYLSASKNLQVATFEGSPSVADIASLTFEFAKAGNIHLVRGDIAHTLSSYLQSVRKIDFVLMDANHRLEPTLRYFEILQPKIHENTVIVMDDIHYSEEMEKAWKQIKNNRLVYGSADLFRCGILFFDPSLNKQHVILQF